MGENMEEKFVVGKYCFTDKEMFERAQKEATVIRSMRERYDLSDATNALKIYQKAAKEGVFSTIVGYVFLEELHETVQCSGIAKGKRLADIPVRNITGEQPIKENHTVPPRKSEERYKKLYEAQCILNKRMKIIVAAAIVVLVSFVIIDLKTEYSAFTYFTNYKAKMEEDLVNKYEAWESELKAREEALKMQANGGD